MTWLGELGITSLITVASGGGGTPERSPAPETGKIVVEIWCYLPEVYTFGAELKSKKYLVKKCEKVNFP